MQPRNPRPILAELENPAAYASELALLSRRHAHVGRRPWQQAGLELADLGPRSQALIAKELARSVPRGEYRFAPSVARVSQVGGKERVLYRANITDTAVIGVDEGKFLHQHPIVGIKELCDRQIDAGQGLAWLADHPD